MKPIILISGTSGIGKSAIAKELFAKLSLDHRQTTGMIREIIAAESSPEKDPSLYSLTYDGEGNPLVAFLNQAKRIEKAVKACIERCRRENSSLILEGNHLVPELYHDLPVDLFVVITNSNPLLHQQRMLQRGMRRIIDEQKFEKIRIIDQHLVAEAKNYGVAVIDNLNLAVVIDQIMGLIDAKRD